MNTPINALQHVHKPDSRRYTSSLATAVKSDKGLQIGRKRHQGEWQLHPEGRRDYNMFFLRDDPAIYKAQYSVPLGILLQAYASYWVDHGAVAHHPAKITPLCVLGSIQDKPVAFFFNRNQAGEDIAEDWLTDAIRNEYFLIEADLEKRRWVDVSPSSAMEKLRNGKPIALHRSEQGFSSSISFGEGDFDTDEAISIPLWCESFGEWVQHEIWLRGPNIDSLRRPGKKNKV